MYQDMNTNRDFVLYNYVSDFVDIHEIIILVYLQTRNVLLNFVKLGAAYNFRNFISLKY